MHAKKNYRTDGHIFAVSKTSVKRWCLNPQSITCVELLSTLQVPVVETQKKTIMADHDAALWLLVVKCLSNVCLNPH